MPVTTTITCDKCGKPVVQGQYWDTTFGFLNPPRRVIICYNDITPFATAIQNALNTYLPATP